LLDLGAHAAHAVDQVLGAAGHELDLQALLDDPSITRTRMTTPRYGSYQNRPAWP
jgi:hypothetical protein